MSSVTKQKLVSFTNIPCSYSEYKCSLGCVKGYNYCIQHILEDKMAPFQQCSFIFTANLKRCFQAAPLSELNESYCSEHNFLQNHKRQNFSEKPVENAEFYLNKLLHHENPYKSSPVRNEFSVAKEALRLHPFEHEEAQSDVHQLPCLENESDFDCIDSDSDPLEHAGIYTIEESSRIYISKLKRLRELYYDEQKSLMHSLRENKKEYGKNLKIEKESLMSISAQPKKTADDKQAYKELKYLKRFHMPIGIETILGKKLKDKRLQKQNMVDGVSPRNTFGKCIYSEGSYKCGLKVMPLSKYCSKHIMEDDKQVLFKPCGVCLDVEDKCATPIIRIPFFSTCIFHTNLPEKVELKEYKNISPENEKNNTDQSDENEIIVNEKNANMKTKAHKDSEKRIEVQNESDKLKEALKKSEVTKKSVKRVKECKKLSIKSERLRRRLSQNDDLNLNIAKRPNLRRM